MTHAGSEVSNSAMATTVRLLKTTANTGGEYLEVEAIYDDSIDSEPEHIHPDQDEHIEVLVGMVSVLIKGQERTYVAGESFDFLRNVPHCFLGAAGSEEARILWQIRPALDSETYFEADDGLVSDRKNNEKG